MTGPHSSSTLFPYTTLFRSNAAPIPSALTDEAFAQPEFGWIRMLASLSVAGQHPQMQCPLRVHLVDDADRKSTRLNSSHANISYAVFCLKKKIKSRNSQSHP